MRVRRLVLGSGLLLGAITTAGAGRLLVRSDSLPSPSAPADVVYVLGGARVDRWLEGVELYQAGRAKHVLLSRGGTDGAEQVLAERGITVPTDADSARAVMVDKMGLPASAVEVLREPVDNTAHEAEALRPLLRQRGWRTVIIITARSASRRAGYAFERTLGNEASVIVHSSRFDDFDAAWWWQHRGHFRQTFYEVPKLFAYWLGLGA